jgi:hypothetical protein
MRPFLLFSVLITGMLCFSQSETNFSIHQEQFEYYQQSGIPSDDWQSLNSIQNKNLQVYSKDCELNKIVYGWHPYWSNGLQSNYDWSMLSHLCYFSFAVDASNWKCHYK